MWTEDDRATALALAEVEEDQCSGCGHPRSETFDEVNEFRYRGTHYICFACAARDRHRERVSKEDQDRHGHLYVAVDRDA